ncbi:hypothetical protein BT63DRAFT_21832 [Microthyrium microscopicum]|uniref:Uncharacterized protein n=1 Tax=Microthyrium microscopicum TaxID=703497 RepID=A0A6A6UTM6_9PEZI|nr:hypothetical protein BT63DRAFT_21832 [Microthyrium microscopicum]
MNTFESIPSALIMLNLCLVLVSSIKSLATQWAHPYAGRQGVLNPYATRLKALEQNHIRKVTAKVSMAPTCPSEQLGWGRSTKTWSQQLRFISAPQPATTA